MADADEWFCVPPPERPSETEPEDESFEFEAISADAARSAVDAAACIDACERVLAQEEPLFEGAQAAYARARVLWRSAWTEWNIAAGNGLSVVDLLWLAQCYLRVCLRVEPRLPDVHVTVAAQVIKQMRQTLKLWSHPQHHASVAVGVDALEQKCAELTVFWAAHHAELTPEMTNVDAENHQAAILSINMDADEEYDNRTRDDDYKGADTSGAPAQPPPPKRARGLLQETHPPDDHPPDPLELVRLGSRLAYFTRLQRVLVTPIPGRYRVTAHAAAAPDIEVLHNHLLYLAKLGAANESLGRLAQLWLQRSLLSLGALDHAARFLHLDMRHVGGGTAVRYDPCRSLEDLALAYKLSLSLPVDALTGVWDPILRNMDACDTHHKHLARDAWILALVQNRFESDLDIDWLETYVVPAHELHVRSSVFQSVERELVPRLPVLVFACSVWCVQYPDECVKCDNVYSALLLWAQWVRERHNNATETGRDITRITRAWVQRPA